MPHTRKRSTRNNIILIVFAAAVAVVLVVLSRVGAKRVRDEVAASKAENDRIVSDATKDVIEIKHLVEAYEVASNQFQNAQKGTAAYDEARGRVDMAAARLTALVPALNSAWDNQTHQFVKRP